MLVESITANRNGLDELLLCKHLGSRGCICIFHIAVWSAEDIKPDENLTPRLCEVHIPQHQVSPLSPHISLLIVKAGGREDEDIREQRLGIPQEAGRWVEY